MLEGSVRLLGGAGALDPKIFVEGSNPVTQ